MKFLLIFLLAFSSYSYGQSSTNDLVMPSKGNGGRIILQPKNSGGTPQQLLVVDPTLNSVTVPAGKTLRSNSITNATGNGAPDLPYGFMISGTPSITFPSPADTAVSTGKYLQASGTSGIWASPSEVPSLNMQSATGSI